MKKDIKEINPKVWVYYLIKNAENNINKYKRNSPYIIVIQFKKIIKFLIFLKNKIHSGVRSHFTDSKNYIESNCQKKSLNCGSKVNYLNEEERFFNVYCI